MKRLSTRSNPTNLKELDRKLISISTFSEKGTPFFKIEKLDLSQCALDPDLEIIIIAAAGNTSKRVKVGTISVFSLENSYDLSELDSSASLRFRLLLHKPGNPKLAAAIEKITPNNDEQSDSILPMKPADLGQRLWKLDTAENDGPVLLFNSNVFPSAAGTENFLPFAALVLPDALRQVMLFIADDPDKLEDEDDIWYLWGKWLDEIGADRPPPDSEDDQEKNRWCEEVVEIFCNSHKFSDKLISSRVILKMINARILNSDGLARFTGWLENPVGDIPLHLIKSDAYSYLLQNVLIDESREFDSRLNFGRYLNEILKGYSFNELISTKFDGLWAWISLVFFNQLTQKGIRRKEHYVVVRKGSTGSLAYRNAPRTSYELFYIHGENSRICLSGSMATMGDLTEQLASRQAISHNKGFFNTASELYIKNGKLVTGASSKPKPPKLRQPNDRTGLGSVRRLAIALQRLDLTYDTEEMNSVDIKQVLPKEFNKFILSK